MLTHVDVLAELDDGTQVIIEIQVAMQVDFIKKIVVVHLRTSIAKLR